MALRRSRVRIPLGPQQNNKPLYRNGERFVYVSFAAKGKLDELGLELSSLVLESSRWRFESL